MQNHRFAKILRFDCFELNAESGELYKDGARVQLQEQPFRILTLLTERPGALVTREEIRTCLWPNGTIVEFDNAMNAAIKKLRVALGDSADEPRYIETVKRRGYRLMVRVEISDSGPSAPPLRPSDSAVGPSESGGTSVHDLTGRRISHYQVHEKIGGGGMGVVYRAEDLQLGRMVALKFLSDELSSDPNALQRLRLEARSASALNHPNICSIYEIGEDSGQPFIAMELLEGSTLREEIAGRALSADAIIGYGCQIAQALDAAHRKGIVHRDIKSANIFMTTEGRAKILDFGLAKACAASDDACAAGAGSAGHLSRAGAAAGTVEYMSPEQVLGQELDTRSDLFSFGVVLYEMVTGNTPFEGISDAAVFDAILHKEPPAPAGTDPQISPRLNQIIAQCLTKDRDLRYQNASVIYTDLLGLEQESNRANARPGSKDKSEQGRNKRWVWIALAAVTAVLVIVLAYLHFRRTQQLTDKDTIVLADFTNKTGDAVFDGTLRQGLAVQLGQSPFLSLISDQRMQRTLRLMDQPADARLTPVVAREICERTGSAAVLEGSIATLGSAYVLALTATNCRTGEVLDRQQAQARSKEDVLNVLSQMASEFRERVGESLATIQQHSTPLTEATTPSLEAWKAFSAGWEVLVSKGHAAALPLFKRATEIDPGFATAYAWLGRTYSAIGESALALESTSKAWQFRERASDQEKFYIEFSYYRLVTGDLQKAMETCELWAQTYPRDMRPHAFWGSTAKVLGQFEKTQEGNLRAIQLDPDHPFAYYNLAASYVFRNRLTEAQTVLRQALDRKLQLPDFVALHYQVAFLQNDEAEMQRLVSMAERTSELGDWIWDQRASVLAYSGHLQQARTLSRRAIELAQEIQRSESAAQHEAAAAVREALFGNVREARRRALLAQGFSKGRDAEDGAAVAMALSGDDASAQKLVDDLERRFPQDTAVRFSYLPTLRALIALNHHETPKAIELLQAASPYELGWHGCCTVGFNPSLYAIYVRGMAYLAAHQGAEAATEFQKILDHRGIVINDPIGVLARLQLGRALALMGDHAKAKTAYQNFLTLWEHADPDIPVFKQAKAEYVSLR